MFAYIMIGTNDRERANVFYDGLMAELGMKRFMAMTIRDLWCMLLFWASIGVCVCDRVVRDGTITCC